MAERKLVSSDLRNKHAVRTVSEVCKELKVALNNLEKVHCDCVPKKVRCAIHARRKQIDELIEELHESYQDYIGGFEG